MEEKIFEGLDQNSSNKDRLDRILWHVIEADKRTIYKEFLEAMLRFGDTTILNSFATGGSKIPHRPTVRGGGSPVPSRVDHSSDPTTLYSISASLLGDDPIAANLDQNGNVYALPLVYVAILVVILVAVPALTYAGITRADVAAIADDLVSRLIEHSTALRSSGSLEVGSLHIDPTMRGRI